MRGGIFPPRFFTQATGVCRRNSFNRKIARRRRTGMRKALDLIRKYNIYSPGDVVWVGVSGGADSVCLLLLLNEIKDELGIQLRAFHVNHNLRGSESDGDEQFVKELCERENIPLKIFSFDVSEYAFENSLSCEEAGRKLRRKAAEECISSGGTKIAFAHHRNDLAETVLFNISRGTSLRGIAGIRPVNGIYTHPLLFAKRSDIEEWLLEKGQPWRTDSTNNGDDYARNIIRHSVIPGLESGINSAATDHIAEAAFDAALAEDLVEETADALFDKYVKKRGEAYLTDTGICDINLLVAGRIIIKTIGLLNGSVKDFGRGNVYDILDLFKKETGSRLSLPFGLEAANEYGKVLIGKKVDPPETPNDISIPLKPGMYAELEQYKISAEMLEIPVSAAEMPKKEYTKWLDYDKIKKAHFRFRKDGDYLIINEDGGRKKLKDLFIDKKIPASERDRIPVLAEGSLVHWAVGVRLSMSAKTDRDTKNVIRIDVSRR